MHVRIAGDGKARVRSVVPSTLSIVGPESRVKEVEYAETDLIDLAGVTAEKPFRVGVFVADPQVRFESASQVTVKVGPIRGRLSEGR